VKADNNNNNVNLDFTKESIFMKLEFFYLNYGEQISENYFR
jgi:hypothetical protein